MNPRGKASTAPEDTASTARFPLYEKAILIRQFEQRLFDLHGKGKLSGTIHTCIGQEFSGIALAEALLEGDRVFSNHRCHGHYLARTDDVEGLLAEVMGKQSGPCGGRGGTQHLCSEGFFSNGIQGGMAPVAAGAALAEKLRGSGRIVAVMIGDGTLGSGVVYETLNLAALWEVPLLIVCEDNQYAQSTPHKQGVSGSICDRAAAFSIPTFNASTWEPTKLVNTMREAVAGVRDGAGPTFVRVDTYRLVPHSKGNDGRDPKEVEHYRRKDPVVCFGREHATEAVAMQERADARIDAACARAEKAPYASTAIEDADPVTGPVPLRWTTPVFDTQGRIGELIQDSMANHMGSDPSIILIGEDIESPYGGAFKVTKGLSTQFPDRVRNTPISEAAIVGAGNGLALNGMRPVCEIMFGDFLTLATDQLINHASKFRFMYDDQIELPLIVRTPMGGKRGYGPTHSQSLEKHFMGLPQTIMTALNRRMDPRVVYAELFTTLDRLCLVIENKALYAERLSDVVPDGFHLEHSDERFPSVRIRREGNPDLTVLCYGGMLEDVEAAVYAAFRKCEIACEIICPTQLYPLNPRPTSESVMRSGKLLVVEEGHSFAAFGAEMIAQVAERAPGALQAVRRLAAPAHPIPASGPLEKVLLPNPDSIEQAIVALCHDDEIIEVRALKEDANDETIRIVRWLVDDGARVDADALLVEAETSKTSLEIAAPAEGFVRRIAKADTDVPIGSLLCLIGGSLAALDRRMQRECPPPQEESSPPPVRREPIADATVTPVAPVVGVPWRAVKQSVEKQAQIRHLSEALHHTLPSAVTVAVPGIRRCGVAAADADALPLSAIVVEVARLLRKYPALNAFCVDGEIRHYEQVNIGFALDIGGGLKVPVFRDADRKTIEEIEEEKQDFIVQYLEDALDPSCFAGGTFTLTDLSSEGVLHFSPMLNRLQSAILGIGAGHAASGAAERMWHLTLGFDHRAAEGRLAARFLGELKERVAVHTSMEPDGGTKSAEEPYCQRCYRSLQEVRESGHHVLRAVGESGTDETLCTLCLSGW